MISTRKSVSILFTLVLFSVSAHAQSPRDELKQLTTELQQSPSDDALREKIIKLALNVKPAPAIPEEAERRMARGSAAFKGATTAADYQDSAKEFDQATVAAPWYGDAYFNLGMAQDKAENYEAALRSLNFATLASPDGKEIRSLIHEVEYRRDKKNSPEARAAREKEADQRFLASLDGTKYDCGETRTKANAALEISKGKFFSYTNHVGYQGLWHGFNEQDASRVVQGRMSQWSYQNHDIRIQIFDDHLVVSEKMHSEEYGGANSLNWTCRRR